MGVTLAPVVQTAPPTEIETGTTVDFTTAPNDYPTSEGWTLTFSLAGVETLDTVASIESGHYRVTIAPAANTLPAGTYQWALYASKTSPAERHLIDRGVVTVRASAMDAEPGALVSQDEKELAVLNAAIQARLTPGKDVASYSIGDRSLQKVPLLELVRWRNSVRSRIAARRRGSPLQAVKMRFAGTSA